MAYQKTVWVNGVTPLNAENMNKIEQGIEDAGKGGDITEITYDELVELRDKSQLIPGAWYRITDYRASAFQQHCRAMNNQFDIIVRADSTNVVNENAFACHHEGDTYFKNSNLAAWQIKYTLETDNSLYAWSVGKRSIYIDDEWTFIYDGTITYDGTTYCKWIPAQGYDGDVKYLLTETDEPEVNSTAHAYVEGTGMEFDYSVISYFSLPGKGTIYYMKDEYNNEAPYDFKNIQFKRWKVINSQLQSVHGLYSTNNMSSARVDSSDYIWCYTFTWVTEDTQIEDMSIVGQTLLNDEGRISGVYNNKILPMSTYTFYYGAYKNYNQFSLNDIVMMSRYEYEDGTTYGCYNNVFDVDCKSITLLDDCNNIQICCNVMHIVMHGTYDSMIGNNCNEILLTTSTNVKIHISCSNIFIDNSSNISIHNDCSVCDIEHCINVTIHSYCNNINIPLGNVNYLTIMSYCNDITISNSNLLRCIVIQEGCGYLRIESSNSHVCNYTIHMGVRGTSASNSGRKIISLTNTNYNASIDIYANKSEEIILD